MVIEFLSICAATASAAYDKGLLFEQLIKRLVRACGYSEIELRRKHRSLEYDITALPHLGSARLVGEAKALQKKISDEILKFIGKMYIIWQDNPMTLGLFISTSELTAEAQDHVSAINRTANLQIIAGEDKVLGKLSQAAGYPTFNEIATAASMQFSLVAGETIFLVTDMGDYYIQLLNSPGYVSSTYFCVYRHDGEPILEESFLDLLKRGLIILKDMAPLYPVPDKRLTDLPNLPDVTRGFINVLYGKGWFDYKLPASPECFIGREGVVGKINSHLQSVLNGETAVRVLEILSRSGVGKSSIVVKLSDILDGKGNVTIVVDCRGIESAFQLIAIYSEFTNRINSKFSLQIDYPTNLRDLSEVLSKCTKVLDGENKLGCICFDQIESLFNKPEAYSACIDVMHDLLHKTKNIVFVIARKNDQYTTYDESSRIDLNRITSISRQFHLDDFNIEEADDLIAKIKVETGKVVSKELRRFILEFSSDGFPWLLKRICAHIVTLIKSGKNLHEITGASFQLEDLFGEELQALDEITREFFLRLVYYLPATANEISDRFPKEERLKEHLATLQQQHRLIRLTGRTYDTYNDVLKEYLKTGQINFNVKYLPRHYPGAVVGLLKDILINGWTSVDDIVKSRKQAIKTLNNTLGQLKQMGLIKYSQGKIEISGSAQRAYSQGTLDDLVQGSIKQNSLVNDLLVIIDPSEGIEPDTLAELMKKLMPFVAASDETWLSYAAIMKSWLKVAGLTASVERLQIGEEYYLPSSYLQHVHKLVTALSRLGEANVTDISSHLGRKSVYQVCKDAVYLGLIEAIPVGYRLSEAGIRYTSSAQAGRQVLRERIIILEPFRTLVNMLREDLSGNYDVAFERLFADKLPTWANSTREWRKKIIGNWLTHSGLIQVGWKKKLSHPGGVPVQMEIDAFRET